MSSDSCVDDSIIITKVVDVLPKHETKSNLTDQQTTQQSTHQTTQPTTQLTSRQDKNAEQDVQDVQDEFQRIERHQTGTQHSQHSQETSCDMSTRTSNSPSKTSKKKKSHVVMCMLFRNIHAVTTAVARGRDLVVALPRALFVPEHHKWQDAFSFMQCEQPQKLSKWVFYDGFNFYNTMDAARTKQFVHVAKQYTNPEYQEEECDTSTQRCMFSAF